MNSVIPKETKDGSYTLFVPELNEHYHSINGAVTESEHIFIRAGLLSFPIESEIKLNILEPGFGTGLNALMTLSAVENKKAVIRYTGIELHPLSIDVINSLNISDKENVLNKIHRSEWGDYRKISEQFFLRKINADFTSFNPDEMYDLVYFDAFSPEVQGELWTEDIFRKIYKNINPGGVLVTYCAKGQVRRNMSGVGFKVERLPGPPGKREMLRAVKEVF